MDSATKWLISATAIMVLLLFGYVPGRTTAADPEPQSYEVTEEVFEEVVYQQSEILLFKSNGFTLVKKINLQYIGGDTVQYEATYNGANLTEDLRSLYTALEENCGAPIHIRILVLSKENLELCVMICEDGKCERI